jgi:hypothetical protein
MSWSPFFDHPNHSTIPNSVLNNIFCRKAEPGKGTALKSKLLAIVSGFDIQDTLNELRLALTLIKISLPNSVQQFVQDQQAASNNNNMLLSLQIEWENKNVEGVVYVIGLLINPTVEIARTAIRNATTDVAFSIVYYGGHANEQGSWILDNNPYSEDDIDDDSNQDALELTKEMFLETAGKSPGQLILNCCYSNKWGVERGPILQLRNSWFPSSSSASGNGEFEINCLRCLFCYDNEVPISLEENQICKELVECFDRNDDYPENFYSDNLGFRVPPKLMAQEGDPPSHDAAVYLFPNKNSGDCYLVTTDNGKCNILIDGNHCQHFTQHWDKVIGKIKSLDLVIGTHVDNDHVGGISGIFHSSDSSSIVKTLWLNAAVPPAAAAEPAAAEPAAATAKSAAAKSAAATAKPAAAATRSAATVANIWSHVPDSIAYKDIVSGEEMIVNENTTVCVLLPTKVSLEDNRLLKTPGPVNELSIVSVVKYKGFSMLFTADSSYATVVAALKSAKLNIHVFDLVTIPHHGSVYNNYLPAPLKGPFMAKLDGKWFHRTVKSKRYVFTGNWESKKGNESHPSKALCNDLDNLLNEPGKSEVKVFLSHSKYNTADYFPFKHATPQIVVPSDPNPYLCILID